MTSIYGNHDVRMTVVMEVVVYMMMITMMGLCKLTAHCVAHWQIMRSYIIQILPSSKCHRHCHVQCRQHDN